MPRSPSLALARSLAQPEARPALPDGQPALPAVMPKLRTQHGCACKLPFEYAPARDCSIEDKEEVREPHPPL
eukprot:1292946-Rhodomonas_salina.1